MRAAMERAGITAPEGQLREIALRCMVKHADNTFATSEAIWAEVQRDAGLMACLFQHGWRREVSALMHRVRNDIAYGESQGTLSRPVEHKAAKVVQLIRAADAREEAERRAEERAWQAQKDREHEEHLAQWRRSRIGNIEINDQPIWQNTVGTVRAWLSTQHRELRTVELLIAGLPDDGRPISYYRKPEEVEALWKQARTAA